MIKNKEDDFLGDSITNNIKYYDNEWQAQGTVDRGSMFTKEPLLHLLFEGTEYDNKINDYAVYTPRTTKSAAKLTHDLMVLDNYYYVASATASSINIFDIETFAKKSFAIANPIYDKNAKKHQIHLIDFKKIGEKKVFDILQKVAGLFTDSVDTGKIKLVIQHRYGISEDKVSTITVEKLKNNTAFVNDFSLDLHDPESIKLPYIPRINTDENSSNINATIYTRFLINTLSSSLKSNNTWTSQLQKYHEYMEDALEESILKEFFEDKSDFYLSGLSDSFENSKYSYENNKAYRSEIIKQLTNIYNGITRCNSEIYVGDSTNLYEKKGMVLLNEEDSSNIFQDDTNNYRLFNKLCICYPTVNDIIGLRTPIGGWKVLLGKNWEQTTTADEKTVVQNDFSKLYSWWKDDLFEANSDFAYQSILLLQNLYEIGTGQPTLSTSKDFELCDPIKQWLANECLIVKAPIYGDYVEELNFMQDLNPDSNVVFKNIRVKQTSIPYNRFQDSKYEIPFVEKTAPLVNKTSTIEKGFGIHASDAIAGVGEYPGNNEGLRKNGVVEKVTTDDKFTTPPFLYDFDKGDQENLFDSVDERSKTKNGYKQRIVPSAGNTIIEGPINSPTIDELWVFLKYLTESDGRNPKEGELDSRVPQFYGLKKEFIENFITGKTGHETLLSTVKNRLNPRKKDEDNTTEVVDILDWEVVTDDSLPQYFDPSSENKCHEFRFGGYNITEHIDKIYDYKIEAFDRRTFKTFVKTETDGETIDEPKVVKIHDGSVYEFDTEKEFVNNNDPYNHPKGYLEKLYNDAIVNFLNGYKKPQPEDVIDEYDLLNADIFEQNGILDGFSVENDKKITDGRMYIPLKKVQKPVKDSTEDSRDDSNNDSNDNNVIDVDDGGVKEISRQRWNAYKLLSRILDYGTYAESDDWVNHPLHNHYKNYLEHPKNLKEIERDLETLRQNLQTAIEYLITTQAEKGFADRNINRGTLHILHRNNYEFTSTLIPLEDVNNTQAENDLVHLKPLTDSLNDVVDVGQNDTSLSVSALDKKVVYDDGRYYEPSNTIDGKYGDEFENIDRKYESRYFHDNYDCRVVDLQGPRINTRSVHNMYRPNETLLSEVYLAADGTWRSVHEHPVIAVLDCEE